MSESHVRAMDLCFHSYHRLNSSTGVRRLRNVFIRVVCSINLDIYMEILIVQAPCLPNEGPIPPVSLIP